MIIRVLYKHSKVTSDFVNQVKRSEGWKLIKVKSGELIICRAKGYPDFELMSNNYNFVLRILDSLKIPGYYYSFEAHFPDPGDVCLMHISFGGQLNLSIMYKPNSGGI